MASSTKAKKKKLKSEEKERSTARKTPREDSHLCVVHVRVCKCVECCEMQMAVSHVE